MLRKNMTLFFCRGNYDREDKNSTKVLLEFMAIYLNLNLSTGDTQAYIDQYHECELKIHSSADVYT